MSELKQRMPRYKCHKEVWALKIDGVEHQESGAVLHFEDLDCGPRYVSDEYVRKHNPQTGGYFVLYEDGYESWSPAEAFENGYTKIG